ncbi:hypothetical protein NEUTE1DRAFT_117022 [Neurospora tetrasperma FGSC 2508]|uniref:Uncharacterized protein n=1 Tax=Neurospora tetrasperma (strain FGSC 2508 / ATCC MYA-4615 / P0657) TaxID=510951 RepID=F8MMX1_NEUT8|nr:uncharacterized protein NEUTE1DRAFT_117022 [Neurospora tetrasperma FGSC 2508]EGO57995.1 hypothetical protein NEUTE1DRAFT_117022 [Neurospora tetrasperma FGSC 2508]EGZ71701.1 hypothetical protein NEUTE2DRAFT_144586 [Neurospora tetrasperma FGSC 2509]
MESVLVPVSDVVSQTSGGQGARKNVEISLLGNDGWEVLRNPNCCVSIVDGGSCEAVLKV